MENIYKIPEFRYDPRVERHSKNEQEKQKKDQGKQKKKQDAKSGALFESLADSLGQYSDEPFQFNG